MKAIFNRLREPSTMAGLSAIAMVFGLPQGTLDLVMQIIVAGAGLAAMVLPDAPAK